MLPAWCYFWDAVVYFLKTCSTFWCRVCCSYWFLW